MERELLNDLSTLQLLVIFIAGSVLIAVVGARLACKFIPTLADGPFEDVASGLRTVCELLLGLILAFVIASVLDKFNDAQKDVGAEATALAKMVRNNLAFPTTVQERLDDAVGRYVSAVSDDEWRTMRHGKASSEAAAALETMYAVYQGFEPRDGAQSDIYSQVLSNLDDVASARRDRLALNDSELPTVLVIMLPIGLLLLLVLEYRPKLGLRSQVTFMGALALALSSTYLLSVVLDYPFSGDVTVSKAPLKSGTLSSLFNAPQRRPQPGDRQLRLTTAALDGEWRSEVYGTILLRHRGDRVIGVYRKGEGTVDGKISADGVYRGVWCQGPDRRPTVPLESSDAGRVEWRLIETSSGEKIVAGTWSLGYAVRANGSFKAAGGWDLHRLFTDDAVDLRDRLATDPPSRYCHAP